MQSGCACVLSFLDAHITIHIGDHSWSPALTAASERLPAKSTQPKVTQILCTRRFQTLLCKQSSAAFLACYFCLANHLNVNILNPIQLHRSKPWTALFNSAFSVVSLSFLSQSAGATVHMVCRSKDKGEEARQELITATGNNVR